MEINQNMLKNVLVSCLILCTIPTFATTYEDAEDNATTGWVIYGNTADATIGNVEDVERGSRVIKLTGNGKNTGYRLGNRGGRAAYVGAWHNQTEKMLKWSMKYDEPFRIYIPIKTEHGNRFLTYTNQSVDKKGKIRGGKVNHGLGEDSIDGTWHTFTRDLEADWNTFMPTDPFVAVNGFFIKGSGYIDDIMSLESSDPSTDTIKPVITLLGDATVIFSTLGDIYFDAGATAIDDVDGNITSNIHVTGLPIDTSSEGNYTVTYSVSDTSGNVADVVTRTVMVKAVADITTLINGKITLDVVEDANITVYDAKGIKVLGHGKSNANGDYSAVAKIDKEGIYKIVSTGGTYVSEADVTKSYTAGDMCVYFEVPNSAIGNEVTVNLSALTTYACAYVKENADLNDPVETKKKIADVNKNLSTIFGFTGNPNFSSLLPSYKSEDFTNGTADAQLSLLMGMFETLAKKLNLEPKDLYSALAKDFSDGKFDGKKNGTNVPNSTSTPSADFLSALSTYTQETTGTKLVEKNIQATVVDSSAVKKTKTGIVVSAPVSSGLNIGSSGAVTSLSYGGKQIVLIGARNKKLVGFDITDPQNPTQEDYTILNQAISDEGFSSIGGVIAIPGERDPIVVLFSYGKKEVLFANLKTQTIEGKVSLNIRSRSSFSGGSAYISGGISDTVLGGVWLATTDGYWFVNTSTFTAASQPVALAAGQIIAENIGADISKGLLFSPNYGSSRRGGLQLVKTAEGQAYALSDTTWSSQIGHITGMSYADAGATDSSYHIGIITPEDGRDLAFIDLSDLSKYTFDDNTSRFVPNDSETNTKMISTFNISGPAGGGVVISGVAVDSETHLALMYAGYSRMIGVAKLEPRDPSATSWNPISKRAYYTAGYSEYSYARDPHAGGVINSITDGKSYGFMLDGSGAKVIQIDLQKFIDANVTDPSGSTYDSYKLDQTPFDGTIIKPLAIN